MAYRGRRPFNDLEVRTILEAWDREGKEISKRERAWFAYGISTGFRWRELSHIKINAVSHQYQVHGHATVEGKYTKNKEGATQPIKGKFGDNLSPREIMQEWLDVLRDKKGIRPNYFVFQSKVGVNRPITLVWARQRLLEICTSNGIYGPVGTHSMRKTFTLKMDKYRQEQFRTGELKEDPNRILMKDGRWKQMETMEHYRDFIYSDWEDIALDFTK